MAKTVLPIDFKDDLLAESMGGKRRYRIIDNGDGTVSLEDVSVYDETGSTFGAGQINATNQAVNESVDKAYIIDDLADVAANTQAGRVMGALAGAELNEKIVEKLNSSVTKYSAQTLEKALASVLGNDFTEYGSYSFQLQTADGYFHVDAFRATATAFGTVTRASADISAYSFYCSSTALSGGADAVLKKLGNEPINITNYATLNGGTGTLADGVYEALPSELIIPCSGYDNISFKITPSWYTTYWIYDNNGNTLTSKTTTGTTAQSFSKNISSISYLRIVVKDTHTGTRDGQFGQVKITNLVMN